MKKYMRKYGPDDTKDTSTKPENEQTQFNNSFSSEDAHFGPVDVAGWVWTSSFNITSVSTLRVPPRQSVDFLSLAQTSRLNFSCKLLNNGRLSRRKYVTGVWKFNSG